jgi:thioester reductase-like protein
VPVELEGDVMNSSETELPETIFFTGFPGFIGKRLVRRLAQEHPGVAFAFLVEERFHDKALSEIASLESDLPGFGQRTRLVVGDITRPDLGLRDEEYRSLASQVTHVWHLAAIYDLAVPAKVAEAVNVDGTLHILYFCEACTRLERLLYISTCYVAGKRQGRVLEDDLDRGQGFNNHYESTKFRAELEVEKRRDRIPSVIFRPAVVVGDSRTGETDKYDGPYFFFQLLRRMPKWLPMPDIGKSDAVINLIPVNFLLDAMTLISRQESAVGKTFHIADPDPMRVADLVRLVHRLMEKPAPVGHVPPVAVSAAMSVKPIRGLLRMPKEVVAYFSYDARFDTTRMEMALDGSGVHCPHMSTYVETLIRYMDEHPEKQVERRSY